MTQQSGGSSERSNDTLLEQAKQGEHEAFVELIRPFEKIIRGIVRSFLRNLGGYEEGELVNEIVLRAYNVLPEFRGNASEFKSWLRQTSWGYCNNMREKLKKEREAQHNDREQLQGFFHSSPQTPDETYFQREREECVQKAIGLLPDKFKKVVNSKCIEGLAYHEIACIMKLPRGTIQSRVSRGIERLTKLLKELHCDEML